MWSTDLSAFEPALCPRASLYPGIPQSDVFIVIEKNTGKPLSGAVAVEPASIVTITEENNVPRIDCHVPSADSDTEDQTGIPRSSKVRGAGGHFLIL